MLGGDEVFPRNDQHAKTFAIFLILVLMMSEVRPGKATQVRVFDLFKDPKPVVNDHLMHKKISRSVNSNTDTDPHAVVATGHNAEHHKQPGWNGKDQGEKIISLEKSLFGLVVANMNLPENAMHHIFMCRPRHKFHKEKGCNQYRYVEGYLHYYIFPSDLACAIKEIMVFLNSSGSTDSRFLVIKALSACKSSL